MQTETQGKKLSRRQALLGALLAGAGAAARPAAAADASCSCLPAPDCNAVCPNGGVPRGDGTQACDCVEIPQNVPPRALALVDGGDAVNSTKWNGKQLRLNHNTSATWIPVITGNYVDYVLKSELTGSLPQIGAATLYGTEVLASSGYGNLSVNDTAVQRDAYGRVIKVGYYRRYYNCNCNCCNCGDDSGCFISAELMTTHGPKAVENIIPGDELVGIDGVHKVVAVVTNTLGRRAAVHPVGHSSVILTEEHIVLLNGKPVCKSEENLQLNKKVLIGANGIKGVYVDDKICNLVSIDDTSFVKVEGLQKKVVTYTPIVDFICERRYRLKPELRVAA